MAKGLTKKQEEILTFILDYVESIGYPPSIREIGKKFEIGSLRGVTVHLDALERKNYIQRSNLPRSIKVTHPEYQRGHNVSMLPLMGPIAAGFGEPLNDQNIEEMIPVPSAMIRRPAESFLLRINGESMIGDGIMPQDLVVITKQESGRQNELVAVIVNGEATIKRLNYTSEGTFLMPSNPKFSPIPVNDEGSKVIGKVVGLLRTY